MNSFVVPGTGITVTDGSVVMLSRFPGKKWIAHYGWYKYSGQQMMGWYFCSIPENSIIPMNDMDANTLTVVSSNGTCPCPSLTPSPSPSPVPPCPNPGDHNPFSDQDKWELDRAFITVNTIAERDALNARLLPDGKLVRVNNDGDSPAYFRWNQVTQVWEEEFFGISVDGTALTEERAKELFAEQDEVEQAIQAAESAQAQVSEAKQVATDAQLAADEAKSQAIEATSLAQAATELTQQTQEQLGSIQHATDSLSTTVADLDQELEATDAKVAEALTASSEAKQDATDAKAAAETAAVDAQTATLAADEAKVAAQQAQQQVTQIENNLDQVVTQKIEQVVSDDKINEAIDSALAEKLPSAVEAEVAEQLEDASWGSLA